MAPADAAGCRVYEDGILRGTIKYGRITGKMLVGPRWARPTRQNDRLKGGNKTAQGNALGWRTTN